MDSHINPPNEKTLLLYIFTIINYFISKYLTLENLQMLFYMVSIISVILVIIVNVKSLMAKKKRKG